MSRQTMTFGKALAYMKEGWRVSRIGWNAGGMWVAYGDGRNVHADQFWSKHTADFARTRDFNEAYVRPYMILKTAQGDIMMGWSPTASDTIAEDWYVLDVGEGVLSDEEYADNITHAIDEIAERKRADRRFYFDVDEDMPFPRIHGRITREKGAQRAYNMLMSGMVDKMSMPADTGAPTPSEDPNSRDNAWHDLLCAIFNRVQVNAIEVTEEAVKYSVISINEKTLEDIKSEERKTGQPQTVDIAGNLYSIVGFGSDYLVIEPYKP